jgi:hypothetical protein
MKLKLYNESTTGDYLISLAIGGEYLERWEQLSLPLWKIYCSRHGLGLAALIEPYEDLGNKRLDWQKLLVGKAINDNKIEAVGIAFIDYDIVPNPYSENIFTIKQKHTISMVSQRTSLPYGPIERLIKRIIYYRNTSSDGRYPLNSYISAQPQKIFKDHDLSPLDDYACGGLFLFNNKIHSEYLEEIFNKYNSKSKFISNDGEEVYLNWHLQNRSDFEWLSYEWHVLWWYEMAEYYSWLYFKQKREKTNLVDVIMSTLGRAKFLHFVGSWEKWAWTYVHDICHREKLEILKSQHDIYAMELESPSLGQIFPNSPTEVALLSK